jgi:ribokinase
MGTKITVLGSFVVDLMGRAGHLPVPGETVKGSYFHMGPGGKGSNQAVAAHRAGGDVTLITKVGNDVFGQVATDFYLNEGMDIRYVFHDDVLTTGIALILVDEKTSQNSILVHPGACGAIRTDELAHAEGELSATGILLTQLETNLDILPAAVAHVHAHGGIAIMNPAPAQVVDPALLGLFDIVTPNETEAGALTGVHVVDELSAELAADIFMGMGVHDVVITMGSQGAFVKLQDGTSRMFPSLPADVVDTTGAGDAFNGGLATALSEGLSLLDAVEFAIVVATLSVTKLGTAPAMPMRSEIDSYING